MDRGAGATPGEEQRPLVSLSHKLEARGVLGRVKGSPSDLQGQPRRPQGNTVQASLLS